MSTILSDPKLVVSLITGAAATAAAIRRDLDTLFAGSRSLACQIKAEQDRIHEIDDFLRGLNGDKKEYEAARQAIEMDRGAALGRLKRLTRELTRQREDPNSDLSFIQRMLLLFRAEGLRAEVAHWGAWAFIAIGLISIFSELFLSGGSGPSSDLTQHLADLMLLGCFGFLVFRGWALAERRATYGYDGNGSRIKDIFAAKRPVNGPMFGAQACFWACSYWVLESMEDFVYDLNSHLNDPNNSPWTQTMESLLKFVAPLLAAVFCRQWTYHELKSCGRRLQRWKPTPIVSVGWKALAVIVAIAMLAGSVVILGYQPKFFEEREHQVALLLQAVIAYVASSQWLVLASQNKVLSMDEPPKVQGVAA